MLNHEKYLGVFIVKLVSFMHQKDSQSRNVRCLFVSHYVTETVISLSRAQHATFLRADHMCWTCLKKNTKEETYSNPGKLSSDSSLKSLVLIMLMWKNIFLLICSSSIKNE